MTESAGKEPWLSIPLADYEGHMEAVGQTAALRRLFSEVYACSIFKAAPVGRR
jgi:hypothetical protein